MSLNIRLGGQHSQSKVRNAQQNGRKFGSAKIEMDMSLIFPNSQGMDSKVDILGKKVESWTCRRERKSNKERKEGESKMESERKEK